MARICIVGGSGYVGLGYAAALADLGNDVIGLDVAEDRVAALTRGRATYRTEVIQGRVLRWRWRLPARSTGTRSAGSC